MMRKITQQYHMNKSVHRPNSDWCELILLLHDLQIELLMEKHNHLYFNLTGKMYNRNTDSIMI